MIFEEQNLFDIPYSLLFKIKMVTVSSFWVLMSNIVWASLINHKLPTIQSQQLSAQIKFMRQPINLTATPAEIKK